MGACARACLGRLHRHHSSDDDASPARCRLDTGVACAESSVGYTCTGSETPPALDASLVCGTGLDEGGGNTSYCCASRTTGNACVLNAAIMSCGNQATGYSCSGTAVPTDLDPGLNCGSGEAAADGTVAYCCGVGAASDSCSPDSSIGSCGPGGTGYACTGVSTPADLDQSLDCGDAVVGADGLSRYCCITYDAGSCSADTSVVGCTGDSYGFSCTSDAIPSDGDPSLVCSQPVAGQNSQTVYCCVGFTSTTCSADPSVVGCGGGSYGFSCTSSASPSDEDSSLDCSVPTAGQHGTSLYCCSR